MPPLWKKTKKINRITQLVSKLRSKHRKSLPVETGFPTSVADLIVKNRDRLKKSAKPHCQNSTRQSSPLSPPTSVPFRETQCPQPLLPIERRLSAPPSIADEIDSLHDSDSSRIVERSKELLRLPPLSRGVSAGLLPVTFCLDSEIPLICKSETAENASPLANRTSAAEFPESLNASLLSLRLRSSSSSSSPGNLSLRMEDPELDLKLQMNQISPSISEFPNSSSKMSSRVSVLYLILVLAFGTRPVATVLTLSALIILSLEMTRKYSGLIFERGRHAQTGTASALGAEEILLKAKELSVSRQIEGIQSQMRSVSRSSPFESAKLMRVTDLLEVDDLCVPREGPNNLRTKLQKKFGLRKFSTAKRGKTCRAEDKRAPQNRPLSDCNEGEKDEVFEDGDYVIIHGTDFIPDANYGNRKFNVVSVVFFLLQLSGLIRGHVEALALSILWCLVVKSFEILWKKVKARNAAPIV